MRTLTRWSWLALLAAGAPAAARAQEPPQSYTVYRTVTPPRIDGALNDAAWRRAPWTSAFVDIEGARKPLPRFATRVRMLWDQRYLYIAASLQEPDVWATVTQRDSVIFRDNDFEVFMDPDGDTREYAELEVNARNTVWDLFLPVPYREGGHADNSWDIAGLRTAVRVAGTLNRPADRDSGWSVEIAIPWRGMERAAHTTVAPRPGQQWRINFSRVEWRADTAAGAYRKVPGQREDNWVWSPQGMVDMHQPESWGSVTFSARRGLPADTERVAAAPPRPVVLSGYRARLAGARLAYHSAHPEADTALLARARSDVRTVAWETDTVPERVAADTVTFVWLTALSGSKGVQPFGLSVDGRSCFTFSTAADSTARGWDVRGCDGMRLTFQATMADRYGDLFGWMWLRVPRAAVRPGMPLRLQVTGADAGSSAWYMTFEHRLAAHPRVWQDPVLVRTDSGAEAGLRVIVDNLGWYHDASVQLPGRASVRQPLEFGANVLRLTAGAVPAAQDRRVVVWLDGMLALDTTLRLEPVGQRDVYVLPYSHNDVGYSDLQERVRRIQWRNIDEALRLIDRTRDYPAEARYKWNVEILWPLESWLAQASDSDRTRFFAAVRAGSIGLNALTAGVLSGLATSAEMGHFLDEARHLRQAYALPITTALISDIPGQSWGMVGTLAHAGIRYFALAPNNGDRIGYTIETWGDRPFWWTSQSGRDSALMWVAGASYSAFHFAPMRIQGEKVLFGLMRRLQAQGYPYVQVQLPYTVDGDNGPNDANLPDFVRDWNTRYVSPRLIIATHGQMFRDFAARSGPGLPAVAGDFTGYWEDGAASSARETRMARNASDRIAQAESLLAMRGAAGTLAGLSDTAWYDVTMWDEHTWGAAASVSDPDAADVAAQWAYKRHFALAADSLSRALMAAALEHGGEVVENAFDVINTASWARSDVVLVPAALSRRGERVVDDRGQPVLSQRLSTGELAVFVRDLPARSARRYLVGGARAVPGGSASAVGNVLTNGLVTLTVDTASGAVSSLTWRRWDGQLVDIAHRRGLADYVYVAGTDTSRAAGAAHVRVRVVEPGPLVAELVVESDAPGARRLVRRVRVVDGLERADITAEVDKLRVRDKEGVHLAFPFRVAGGQVRFDVADAIVRPDSDQLAGSSRNVVNVQSWVDVSNDSVGVTWATPDAPLVEIGGLNAEQGWMRSLPRAQTFYSYVMNNYWHTNYRADQEGPVAFRYALRPHARFVAQDAERFGHEAREPLIVTAAFGPHP